MFLQTSQAAQLSHLNNIELNISVRGVSINPTAPFKMHEVGYVRSSLPVLCRVNNNTFFSLLIVLYFLCY